MSKILVVADAEGNRRRTKIEYGAFGLPSEVYEQGPDGTNDWRTLRRTHTLGRAGDQRLLARNPSAQVLSPVIPGASSISSRTSIPTPRARAISTNCGKCASATR